MLFPEMISIGHPWHGLSPFDSKIVKMDENVATDARIVRIRNFKNPTKPLGSVNTPTKFQTQIFSFAIVIQNQSCDY